MRSKLKYIFFGALSFSIIVDTPAQDTTIQNSSIGFIGSKLGPKQFHVNCFTLVVQGDDNPLSIALPISKKGIFAGILLNVPEERAKFNIVCNKSGSSFPVELVIRDSKTGASLLKSDSEGLTNNFLEIATNSYERNQVYKLLINNKSETTEARILGEEITFLGEPFPVRLMHCNFRSNKRELPGSPLFDEDNKIIGLMLSFETEENKESEWKQAYALSGQVIEKLKNNYKAGNSSQLGWIGLQLDQRRATPVVSKVLENSPCEKAGIQVGDVILKIGDQDTNRLEDVIAAAYYFTPEQEVTISYVRGVKNYTTIVVPIVKN